MNDAASPGAPGAESELTFEQALEQLAAVVSELEGGQTPLDRALSLYERGIALREICRARLLAAEGRLEQLVARSDGGWTIETQAE